MDISLEENDRLDQLTIEIENYFDPRDPFVVPPFEPQVERHIMDMFEVTEIAGRQAILRHFFNDKSYSVTIGEVKIADLIRPGDVFLAAIIQRLDQWRVWHMSPPYETIEIDETRES
jgi:hypothetical protein